MYINIQGVLHDREGFKGDDDVVFYDVYMTFRDKDNILDKLL